ncbi:MAG: ABC transporter ATP-binding protein [Candidatus Binatus sp.]|uniref:ABC transporter ATP-binding protein n=1 Tax=Candidatus Binatus sp. TaxID=2811406 RepID=UPI003BB0D53E
MERPVQVTASEQAKPALLVRGLRKSFGARVAVDSVGFTIAAGEIYGLLGPNGAGKTTSISMIAGILARDAGEITVDGIDIDAGLAARALIGIVPQAITLYLDLTARENLDFWGRMYDLSGAPLHDAIKGALEAVGLTPRADDIVGTYSGGMQRRLNLACGILHRPKVLILDEPTVGVDPQSRSAIFDLVERLRDTGTAILYTTHYMEEAERLCARIGIIDSGRLIAEGTRDELIASLGHDARVEIGLGRGDSVERAERIVGALKGVRSANVENGHLHVVADHGARRLPAMLTALLDAGAVAESVRVVEPNLEDVFLRMTGRALRD